MQPGSTAREFDDILSPPPLHDPLFPACVIRSTVDDFEVEEIPAYEPDGKGSHLLLWIEKRGLASSDLLRHVARVTGIDSREIGCAGQKDKHAVTRQYISVPASAKTAVSGIDTDSIRVLSATPHAKKLRTGHLRGNKFSVTVRRPEGSFSDADARAISDRLNDVATWGFANYYGPQRFGNQGATLEQGLQFFVPGATNNKDRKRVQPWLRRLLLSAVQSAVFNRVTACRVRAKSLMEPVIGDVVIRKGGTRPYLYEGPSCSSAVDGESGTRGQTVLIPAGPIPGPEMLASTGEVAAMEEEQIADMGLSFDSFSPHKKLCRGTRRAMREFVGDPSVQTLDDQHLRLSFSLSRGCYATTMLREIFDVVHNRDTNQNESRE